ncbi:hypothetical protein ACFORL_08895 [Legionella dresdenensis]|uniref:Uncharacterized protein n=1 Tax=Legionella dresdenensis TaxID=450200 RepID=A0ABV8CG68_9GAMM
MKGSGLFNQFFDYIYKIINITQFTQLIAQTHGFIHNSVKDYLQSKKNVLVKSEDFIAFLQALEQKNKLYIIHLLIDGNNAAQLLSLLNEDEKKVFDYKTLISIMIINDRNRNIIVELEKVVGLMPPDNREHVKQQIFTHLKNNYGHYSKNYSDALIALLKHFPTNDIFLFTLEATNRLDSHTRRIFESLPFADLFLPANLELPQYRQLPAAALAFYLEQITEPEVLKWIVFFKDRNSECLLDILAKRPRSLRYLPLFTKRLPELEQEQQWDVNSKVKAGLDSILSQNNLMDTDPQCVVELFKLLPVDERYPVFAENPQLLQTVGSSGEAFFKQIAELLPRKSIVNFVNQPYRAYDCTYETTLSARLPQHAIAYLPPVLTPDTILIMRKGMCKDFDTAKMNLGVLAAKAPYQRSIQMLKNVSQRADKNQFHEIMKKLAGINTLINADHVRKVIEAVDPELLPKAVAGLSNSKEQLMADLEAYKVNREQRTSKEYYCAPFSRFFGGYSKTEKFAVVDKIIKRCNGEAVGFTYLDKAIALEGDLGITIKPYLGNKSLIEFLNELPIQQNLVAPQ